MDCEDQAPPGWEASIYRELHELAAREMAHEAAAHSLQPTVLVNDAFLRLLEQKNVWQADRAAVLAAGAVIIRRLLIDYARKRRAAKRGGKRGRGQRLSVSVAASPAEPNNGNKHLDLIALDEALNHLAQTHSRAASVVAMKFFGGMTHEEIAEHLGLSQRTVKSDWAFAKANLYRMLSGCHS